ncbi:MAG: lysophospholipase L1-like esterase [Cyclobacteriaceae bacterium]|jgi:lysophospholipase L1-like esterase
MNLKYLLGSLISIPLLPLMYYQGKKIKASVPKLPEAEGNEGVCLPLLTTDKKLQVVSLGESTMAGVGVDTHEEGFTGTFAKELSKLFGVNIFWKVYARSGYTAKRVLEKLVPKINVEQIDLIIIGLGGNDAFTLNNPNKWNADIRALIDSLHSKYPDAVILFCNMPPIKEFPAFTALIKFTIGNLVEILGQELKTIANDYSYVFYFEEKLTFLGWIEKMQLDVSIEDFFSDGVHPSKLTYQTWAKDIANNISNNEQIKNALKATL